MSSPRSNSRNNFGSKSRAETLVTVTVVCYNSGRFIRRCLESALAQSQPGVDVDVIVIDNASSDGTVDILETFEDRCQIVYNQENIGFAAAQNQAIGLSRGEWILTLNPDVLLMPGFAAALAEAGKANEALFAANCSASNRTSKFPTSRGLIRRASSLTRCCATWTAEARKLMTAAIRTMNMCSARRLRRRCTGGR
jgi:GT2 family glycosyltransferase